MPHLTDDPICKPKVIVHTFTFHANCKMGSFDRLDMSGVAMLMEGIAVGSQSYVPSLSALADPIFKPTPIEFIHSHSTQIAKWGVLMAKYP